MKVSEVIKLIEAKTGKTVSLVENKLLLEGVFDNMPSNFKKFVTRRQAGENSKLIKIISGFSQKNKLYQLLKEEKSNYIAFLGKVNNSWAFMITIDESSKKMYRFFVANDLIEMLTSKFGPDNNKSVLDKDGGRKSLTPSVYTSDGQVAVKNYKYFSGKKHVQSGYYSEYELSMDDLWKIIPTGDDVDLYGISIDVNRQKIQGDRIDIKKGNEVVSGIKPETIKKYIKNKFLSSKIIDELKESFLKAGEGILSIENPKEIISRINDLKTKVDSLQKDIKTLEGLNHELEYYIKDNNSYKTSDILNNKRILNLIKTGKAY